MVNVSGYFATHRSEYLDRLHRVSTEGAWTPWLRFVCQAIATQAIETRERLDQLDARRTAYREQYAELPPQTLHQIIEALFEQPCFRISTMADRVDVAYTTVNRAIERLVADGIVEEVTGGEYDRFYRATEVMRDVQKPLSRLQSSAA
jgi:Fic family protein